MASAQSGTGPFDWSTSGARWIPPWRSRPRLIGTRRIVVSFIRPVTGSRTRWVTLVGISCHTASTRSAPIVSSRVRMVRIFESLPLEDRPRRDRVALDLVDQRLTRREGLGIPQPAQPLYRHRRPVQVAGEIEQMNLEAAGVRTERGA